MSRFETLFRGNRRALIPYWTLGDPTPERSLEIVRELAAAGADALELGIPFSDPIADGPVLQAASQRALSAGMTVDRAWELIGRLRAESGIPIGLLTYANLPLARGLRRFCLEAAQAGADAALLADLPPEEAGDFGREAHAVGLDCIFTATPGSSPGRLGRIKERASGYLYLVAAQGTTGAREAVAPDCLGSIPRIRDAVSLPVCVGFGLSTPEHVRAVWDAGADGAIVGSALAKAMQGAESWPESKRKVLGKFRELKATQGGKRTC